MLDLVCIEIGGINFFLNSSVPIVFQEDDLAYRSFILKFKNQKLTPDVNIQLELGRLPDTREFKKIFTSGQSWSMYESDDLYWLARNPLSFKTPLWVARFNKKISDNVVIYCSDELVSEKKGETVVNNPFRYPLDQILVMYILALNQGAIFHAAGIDINGKGFIFLGPSGAGKSTLSRQFKDQKKMEIYSDDRIIIRKRKETFLAFGTPWPGEEGVALNKNFPLSGIILLSQGPTNQIKEVHSQEALKKFLKVISIPWYDKEVVSRILDFCEDVIDWIPFYELQFTPSPEVAAFFEDFSLSI